MNNDLLNYSSKNPKKIEKSNTFSKNNEIRINSKNKAKSVKNKKDQTETKLNDELYKQNVLRGVD